MVAGAMYLKSIIAAAFLSLAAVTIADQLREGPPHIGGNHVAPEHVYKGESSKHHKARAGAEPAYPYGHLNVDKNHDPAQGDKHFPRDAKEAWQSFKNGAKPSDFQQDDAYPKLGVEKGKSLSRSKHQERDAMARAPLEAVNDGAKGVKNSRQQIKKAAQAKGKYWARGATQDFESFKHGKQEGDQGAKAGWGANSKQIGRGKWGFLGH